MSSLPGTGSSTTNPTAFLRRFPDVRYAAVYQSGVLTTVARENLAQASDSISDRYEELFVNPGVLTLLRQRGNIDCGGLHYVMVRYGNFYQLLFPLLDGHISLCVAASAQVAELAREVFAFIAGTDGAT